MENEGGEMRRSTAAAGDAKEEKEQQQPPPQGKVRLRDTWTPAECAAANAFFHAAFVAVFRYMAMTEEDVVEEYRRAGKLHKYDPDKEWQKRFARVARAHPPPDSLIERNPQMKQYFKYLDEEDEQD